MIKDNSSYSNKRPELIAPINIIPKNVIDVGCNNGQNARLIKDTFSEDTFILGIDINKTAIEEAKKSNAIDEGYTLDLDNLLLLEQTISKRTYNLIILGDVLEHLKRPIDTLHIMYKYLEIGGEIIISLPNFAHWGIVKHLMVQKLPRRDRGIYDDTHLHFFMKNNLREFQPTGSQMRIVSRQFRFLERSWTKYDKYLTPILSIIPWLREYFVHQYIFKIIKYN